MTEQCVRENARIAQNQEEYQRHYEGLVARCDAAKERFDEVTEAVSAKEVESERLAGFMLDKRRADGFPTQWETGADVMKWWIKQDHRLKEKYAHNEKCSASPPQPHPTT